MEYTLKDKLNVTKDFIEELTEKSWQEIEQLQNQVANIADTDEGTKVKKLLNNLLTSYYVFVGGLENFDSVNNSPDQTVEIHTDELNQIEAVDEPGTEVKLELASEPLELTSTSISDLDVSEPFEYFVDFDDPIGAPLTDEDLYNN
jgi:hypothetical protein